MERMVVMKSFQMRNRLIVPFLSHNLNRMHTEKTAREGYWQHPIWPSREPLSVCDRQASISKVPGWTDILIGKDSDAGRDWGQEKKGTTEDEMAGWHHWLDGRESEWTPGVGDGQGGLACCNSWGHKESDTTEWLNWTELKRFYGRGSFWID